MKSKTHRRKRQVRRRQIYQLKRAREIREYDENNTISSVARVYRKTITLIAPEIFNLRYENCIPVVRYINSIKKTASEGRNVIVDLQNVTDIREGAIAMLLSVMREVGYTYRISIQGSEPKDKAAKKILEQSGFFRFVSRRTEADIPDHKNVMRTGYRHIKLGFLGQDIKTAMETVWGTEGRNPLLRGSIYEMMRNSADHAFRKAEKIRWHFSISHDDSNKLVKFSFVDNGKGILNSMKKSKIRNLIHNFVDGADVLDTAYKDGMESRTGLKWRGKGLPFIYENYTDNIVKNFLIITNNVFIHYDEGIKKLLPVSYNGTYYYWEIDKSCQKACFEG